MEGHRASRDPIHSASEERSDDADEPGRDGLADFGNLHFRAVTNLSSQDAEWATGTGWPDQCLVDRYRASDAPAA